MTNKRVLRRYSMDGWGIIFKCGCCLCDVLITGVDVVGDLFYCVYVRK